MPQNEQRSPDKNISDLRNEWRKAFHTSKRIQAHVIKLQDGSATYLSSNGITLLLDERTKLKQRMRAIEDLFSTNHWAL